MSYLRALLFPLSFVVYGLLYFAATLLDSVLHAEGKVAGLAIFGFVFVLAGALVTTGLAIAIRRLSTPGKAFIIEAVIATCFFCYIITESATYHFTVTDPEQQEFVVLYDRSAKNRLTWRWSENSFRLFTTKPTITNRRALLVDETIERTAAAPDVYWPEETFYNPDGTEVTFYRYRIDDWSTGKYRFLDYYSRKKHQVPNYDAIRSPVLDEAKRRAFGEGTK